MPGTAISRGSLPEKFVPSRCFASSFRRGVGPLYILHVGCFVFRFGGDQDLFVSGEGFFIT